MCIRRQHRLGLREAPRDVQVRGREVASAVPVLRVRSTMRLQVPMIHHALGV
jgi:hypothetical protein